MSSVEKCSIEYLKAGQVWKVRDGYLHIVIVGKRLVHYRLLKKLQQKAASGKLASHDEIVQYLEQNKARPAGQSKSRDRKRQQ
jgi:hypothetical protein